MEGPLDSCLLDAGAVRKTDGLSLTDQGIVVAQPQKQARSEKRQGDRLRARAPEARLPGCLIQTPAATSEFPPRIRLKRPPRPAPAAGVFQSRNTKKKALRRLAVSTVRRSPSGLPLGVLNYEHRRLGQRSRPGCERLRTGYLQDECGIALGSRG